MAFTITTPPWDSWSCQEAALFYARMGLPIFPLAGKIPIIPARKGGKGVYDATTDEDQIRHWWSEYPEANIGLPTGSPSGWWVMDVDARHNGFEEIHRLHRDAQARCRRQGRPYTPPEATLTAYTGGGGLHLIYRCRENLSFTLGNKAKLGGYEGVDIRGEGGYIAVAPSLHPDSGRRYTWLFCGDLRTFPGSLAPFPDIYLDLAAPRHEPPPPPPSHKQTWGKADILDLVDEAIQSARPGTRHKGAMRLAGKLKRRGVSLSQAEHLLREYARRVPQTDHPYPEHDAVNVGRWVYSQPT